MRLTRKKLSSGNKKIKQIVAAESNGNRLQYRCTIQGIKIFYEEVRAKLRKEHHDAFEKTPFKHLFKALHDDEIIKEKKKDKLLDNLILCYDRKTRKFKFGSGFYKPTRLDVKLIFGIEDGTEDVGETAAYGRESKLGTRYFAKGRRITVKRVKDKVKELIDNEDQESIDDTVKLLCVLILHNVLFPNTGASITRGFLYYVDDFDRLNSYDWSQHVLDELMSGLRADWSKPKQVNGCILLLPYWFCEHLYKIPDLYKNGEENEPMETGAQGISSKGIPRLTKWKLKNLEKLVEKSVLHKMDGNMFNNNELIPSIAEEHLIKSLSVKQKAKNIVMEHDLDLGQPPADDETFMSIVKRKSERLKKVTKKKAEEGSGVESGYSSEGNQDSEAAQAEKDIESGGMSNEEAESAHDELIAEARNSSKGKSIAEAKNVRVQKKKELGKTVSLLGKRKKRLAKEKEKNGIKKDVKMKKLENENSRLKGIVDKLKCEQKTLIGKQETMAAEHFEMEIALDEEVSKKTELLCELENEKLARKELLNELALAKIKIEQQEDKAKENESMVHNLQAYIQNLVQGSGNQNFGQESVEQQEVDRSIMETLGERVGADHFEMEVAVNEETMAAEHFEMEMALDEEITKKTELLCELENESKAKEIESVVLNLQNLVPGSGSQNFGEESIQQQEVDNTMIEPLGERVAAKHFEMEMALGEETMTAEHFEMEVALDEEITKKTELLCEQENESEAKENESVVQNLQTYIQNLVPGSGSQNFCPESIQEQEVDKTMIESLGGVARLDEVVHEKDTTVSNLKDNEGST